MTTSRNSTGCDPARELRARKRPSCLTVNRNYFGAMMVRMGDADGLVGGINKHYPETIRPALQTLPLEETTSVIAGMYMMVFPKDVMFFADTTVNIDPTAEQLAEIAICAADTVKRLLEIKPRIAMLSFSNFGSTRHPMSAKSGPCGADRQEAETGPQDRWRDAGRHRRYSGDSEPGL